MPGEMSKAGFRLTALGDGRALMEPGFGVNPGDPGRVIDAVLERLVSQHIRTLYYDLAAVEIIDSTYLGYLNRLARACRTVGVEMVCIHLRPATAFALAGLLSAPPEFSTSRGIEAEPRCPTSTGSS